MGGEGEEVDVERFDVDGEVWDGLGGVYEDFDVRV